MNKTTVSIKRGGARDARDDYLKLVRSFPLRPLRTRTDYDQAMQVLQELVGRGESSAGLSIGENDYADVLTQLVREYDQRHSSILRELAASNRMSPIESLKYLMREHGMNTVSLGKLVGGSGQASMILNGKRELSKANIRTLATHFHVSTALFI
jgi:HTH-type transcriptional regulator/antitoxin HigA